MVKDVNLASSPCFFSEPNGWLNKNSHPYFSLILYIAWISTFNEMGGSNLYFNNCIMLYFMAFLKHFCLHSKTFCFCLHSKTFCFNGLGWIGCNWTSPFYLVIYCPSLDANFLTKASSANKKIFKTNFDVSRIGIFFCLINWLFLEKISFKQSI